MRECSSEWFHEYRTNPRTTENLVPGATGPIFDDETGSGTHTLNPLPDEKILGWSKLKQIADDILKCI